MEQCRVAIWKGLTRYGYKRMDADKNETSVCSSCNNNRSDTDPWAWGFFGKFCNISLFRVLLLFYHLIFLKSKSTAFLKYLNYHFLQSYDYFLESLKQISVLHIRNVNWVWTLPIYSINCIIYYESMHIMYKYRNNLNTQQFYLFQHCISICRVFMIKNATSFQVYTRKFTQK